MKPAALLACINPPLFPLLYAWHVSVSTGGTVFVHPSICCLSPSAVRLTHMSQLHASGLLDGCQATCITSWWPWLTI